MTLNHMMIAFIVDLKMNHQCWQDHDFEINYKYVNSYTWKLNQIRFFYLTKYRKQVLYAIFKL